MNYSRLYQFTPIDADGGVALEQAVPGSNGDAAHEALFDALKAVFHSHPRRQFGIFDATTAPSVLAVAAGEYQRQAIDADALAQRLAAQMQPGISGSVQPWYLWVIGDQSGDSQLIYLFLFKHDEVNHISAQQTVMVGRTIQPGRLQFAAKLSLDEWREEESKTYLCVLQPKSRDPVALAWQALVGFAEAIDRSIQTEQFLTVVDRYAEQLPPEKEQEYRTRVVSYCLEQDRAGEPVELGALSHYVDENEPEALRSFYTEHYAEPAAPIYADRQQLKRYTRLFGRDNDLSIGFSTLMLGRDIIYDEASGTLTIRAIPKSLKSQLARHIKKGE